MNASRDVEESVRDLIILLPMADMAVGSCWMNSVIVNEYNREMKFEISASSGSRKTSGQLEPKYIPLHPHLNFSSCSPLKLTWIGNLPTCKRSFTRERALVDIAAVLLTLLLLVYVNVASLVYVSIPVRWWLSIVSGGRGMGWAFKVFYPEWMAGYRSHLPVCNDKQSWQSKRRDGHGESMGVAKI